MAGKQEWRLKSVYYRTRQKPRLVFRYHHGLWERLDVLQPFDIPHALKQAFQLIETAYPGSIALASEADLKVFNQSSHRTRRYIAQSPDLLCPDSPHLRNQSVEVHGYHVLTNIPWRDVPGILKLVCDAAKSDCAPLSQLTL